MFGRGNNKEKVQTEKGKYKFLISLLLAVAVTMGLITYEDYKLSDYETVTVLCVNKNMDTIAEGTVITEENADEYFYTMEVQKELATKNALTSVDELIGKKTSVEMYANEIVTSADFTDVNDELSSIIDPVETSINASDLSQLVGGILREGDIIDISIIGEEGEVIYKLDGVYVTKAFNTSGEMIDKNASNHADADSNETVSNENAMIVNVIMSKSDEQALNRHINNGRIRVAKTNDVVE